MPKITKESKCKRINKKALLFKILACEPELSAAKLVARANQAGISLTLIGAYRALKTFRDHDGRLEESEGEPFRVVSRILRDLPAGSHLPSSQIISLVRSGGFSFHQATIYRVLASLRASGLVQVVGRGRKRAYEWKRTAEGHGHLKCIGCGGTIEFSQEHLENPARKVCAELGYELDHIEFVVHSRCTTCRPR